MQIKMIGDRILVKQKEKEETNKTSGGIILTTEDPTENFEGVVVEVGPGFNRPLTVQKGDTVIFPKSKYPKYQDFIILQESSVLLCLH